MDPITGRRADQMNGQEATGSGSSGSPGRNGTPPGSPSLPFWALDGGGGRRADVPAGFGRSQRTVPSPGPNGSSGPSGSHGSNGYGPGPNGRAGSLDAGLADVTFTGPEPARDSQAGPDQPHHVFPRRAGIGHMARDSRLAGWRRRLLIALAAGILFTIFTGWRLGLTVAVLAGIADAVIRARSTAASSAQGLTSSAQRRTKRELAKLDRSGYRTLHVREIPGSGEVIDHLLIGPTGVYAIDSEQWDKRLPVRTKNGRQLWHGPYSQKHRLDHARWEAAQASDLIGHALGQEITVRPAMAVYGPPIPWGIATIRDVDVFSGDRLRRYLRRPPRGAAVTPLAQADVERIYAVAERVLPAKH